MANNTVKKMITLMSSDGKEYIISEAVAMKSQMISYIIEDSCAQNSIPLPNVTSMILEKVLEYCKMHVYVEEAEANFSRTFDEELKKWDQLFVEVDLEMLYHIIEAANYLNIKELLDLTCQRMADMIKNKSHEEIRNAFHIKNEFTLRRKRRSAARTSGLLTE